MKKIYVSKKKYIFLFSFWCYAEHVGYQLIVKIKKRMVRL